MSISISHQECPSALEFKRFKKFSNKNWGKHFDSDEDLKQNFFDKPNIVVFANSNNKLVGLLDLFIRKISFANKVICLGGVGGVVTDINHRHQGIATKMLVEAMKILLNKNVDVALLCTDIKNLGILYKGVGFIPLGRSYYFMSKDGKVKTERDGMIAPVKSNEIFKQIVSSNALLNIGHSNF